MWNKDTSSILACFGGRVSLMVLIICKLDLLKLLATSQLDSWTMNSLRPGIIHVHYEYIQHVADQEHTLLIIILKNRLQSRGLNWKLIKNRVCWLQFGRSAHFCAVREEIQSVGRRWWQCTKPILIKAIIKKDRYLFFARCDARDVHAYTTVQNKQREARGVVKSVGGRVGENQTVNAEPAHSTSGNKVCQLHCKMLGNKVFMGSKWENLIWFVFLFVYYGF